MSDWRKRAKPVEVSVPVEPSPTKESAGGWRDRATPIEDNKIDLPAPLQALEDTGGWALEKLGDVGKLVDTYTGAPTRSAIEAFAKPEGGVTDSIAAFMNQFGEDPDLAPKGSDIAEDLGFGTERSDYWIPRVGPQGIEFSDPSKLNVSPVDVAGFGVDVLADPTNLIPGAFAAKGAAKAGAKGAGKLLKGAGRASANFLENTIPEGSIKTAAKDTSKALSKIFKSRVAEDFDELADVASRNGIDPNSLPESIRYGDNSLISRGARAQREGILGEPQLEKFEESLRQVRDATDNKISEIGGGARLQPVDAGNLIRDGYDRAVDEFFDSVDVSYDSIVKDFPGLKIEEAALEKLESSLTGVERFAKGRAKRGVTELQRGQAKGLLNAVEAVRASNGSAKQVLEAMRDIGEAAFKPSNTMATVPADVAKMRKMYGDLSQAFFDTIESSVENGVVEAGALRINNARMVEFFGNKSKIAKQVGNPSMSPEGLFRSLIANGGSDQITALRNILSPEDFQQLKGAMLESLIKRQDDASYSFRTFKNAIRNKKTSLEYILDPGEADEIADLVRLGDRFGDSKLSSSGSSAGNILKNIQGGLHEAILNQSVIDNMKSTADRAYGASKGVDPPPGMSMDSILSSGRSTGGLPPRTRLDEALKSSQVFATSQEERVFDPTVLGEVRAQIQSDSSMSSIEKAKRLSQINKDGFVTIPRQAPPIQEVLPPVAGDINSLISDLGKFQ